MSISESMLNGTACNKCGCALDVLGNTGEYELPINCNQCHEKHWLVADNGIYSEKFWKTMTQKQDIIMLGKAIAAYHAEVEGIIFSERQLDFISRLLYNMNKDDKE